MYIPSSFTWQNTDEMLRFVRQNSFGTLFSQVNGHSFATHLPFLIREVNPERKILLGHFAKANPHWKEIEGTEVLAVFQGPHAYISPSWCAEEGAVPTWNYVAVHVTGRCHIITDPLQIQELLVDMVRFYEPESTLLERLSDDPYVKLGKAVVGLEIEISAIEGKEKLSQNKSENTMRGVIDGLRQSSNHLAIEVSNLMQRNLDRAGDDNRDKRFV